MDYFDALPHYLTSPPTESVFVSMVRTLMREPQATMNHAVFGRKFTGAKEVILGPSSTLRQGLAPESSFAIQNLMMFTSVQNIIGSVA